MHSPVQISSQWKGVICHLLHLNTLFPNLSHSICFLIFITVFLCFSLICCSLSLHKFLIYSNEKIPEYIFTRYQLEVGGYKDSSSTLGDAIVAGHNLSDSMFSTLDRDNDGSLSKCWRNINSNFRNNCYTTGI